MYSTRSIRTLIPGGPGTDASLDLRVKRWSRFLVAGGWSVRVIGSEFVVTTTSDMTLSAALAGTSTYIFWKVTNSQTGRDILVVDVDRSDLAALTTDGQIIVGSQSSVATHGGVVAAILLLFPGWNASPLSATSTRFSTTFPNNVSVPVGAGAALSTNIPASAGAGGYVCRCQPSRKTVLKAGIPRTYGDENFIELYIRLETIGPNRRVYFSGAKRFPPRPLDATVIPSGTTVTNGSGRTPHGTFEPGGGGSPSMGDVYAFATPYHVFGYDLTTAAHLGAGALKLVDGRAGNQLIDLTIDEATFVTYSISGTVPGVGWHNNVHSNGIRRYCMNNRAVYLDSTSDRGVPAIIKEGIGDSNSAQPTAGIAWADGSYPLTEPWFGFNVFSSLGVRPILGLVWDATYAFEFTNDPRNTGLIPFDGELFRRFGRTGTVTICFRETGFWSSALVL